MTNEEYKQFNCILCGFSVKAKTEEELSEHIEDHGFRLEMGRFPQAVMKLEGECGPIKAQKILDAAVLSQKVDPYPLE